MGLLDFVVFREWDAGRYRVAFPSGKVLTVDGTFLLGEDATGFPCPMIRRGKQIVILDPRVSVVLLESFEPLYRGVSTEDMERRMSRPDV